MFFVSSQHLPYMERVKFEYSQGLPLPKIDLPTKIVPVGPEWTAQFPRNMHPTLETEL